MLKQEPEALVELLGVGAEAVVRKVYRNRGVRWWQTFARRSRAQREFENLQLICASGTSCLVPLDWSETRRLLFVNESSLVTRYLPDCDTLKAVLAKSPSDEPGARRQALATAAGRLVGSLHRHGLLWCTPMPRNMLVIGNPSDGRLAVCDPPKAIALKRPLHGTRLSLIDLYDAAFSASRRRDFSATERMRWLLGYCDGDRELARRLWRSVIRRGALRQDFWRAVAVLWFVYILRPLRAPRSPHKRTS